MLDDTATPGLQRLLMLLLRRLLGPGGLLLLLLARGAGRPGAIIGVPLAAAWMRNAAGQARAVQAHKRAFKVGRDAAFEGTGRARALEVNPRLLQKLQARHRGRPQRRGSCCCCCSRSSCSWRSAGRATDSGGGGRGRGRV